MLGNSAGNMYWVTQLEMRGLLFLSVGSAAVNIVPSKYQERPTDGDIVQYGSSIQRKEQRSRSTAFISQHCPVGGMAIDHAGGQRACHCVNKTSFTTDR